MCATIHIKQVKLFTYTTMNRKYKDGKKMGVGVGVGVGLGGGTETLLIQLQYICP